MIEIKKKIRIKLEEKQFNRFWEIKCPHCGETITIEVLLNLVGENRNEHDDKE
ncbi:MAG: hypothetical protein J7K98_02180 [Candidatus Aenigmarchaeota archaeon]|nr:hypothetical protein [Candidatus Aenigmarchaeota archaeon]